MVPATARVSRTVSAPVPRFLIPAVTPVDRKGNFDEPLWRDMLGFFQDKNVDGVLVLGSTGEFSSFSVRERQKILEAAVKRKGKLEVICHVSTPNLPETMGLMLHATKEGADSVLIMPPFYFKRVPLQGLVRYFSTLLEAARVPVLLYHIPASSGVPISPELLRALSGYAVLYGIKDSSGDPKGLVAFIKDFPKLKIFTGLPNLIGMVIQNGGAGVISAAGNLLPGETAAVFQDYRAGKDIAPALARLSQVSKFLGGDAGSMKFILGQLGLRESYCRPPFLLELSEETKATLKERVAKYRAAG